MADLFVAGIRIALDDLFGGHDHARRTVTALEPVFVPKGFLHPIELAVFSQAFDGEHLAAVGLYGEHGATFDRLSVHVDGASAADGGLAANVRPRESSHLPEV